MVSPKDSEISSPNTLNLHQINVISPEINTSPTNDIIVTLLEDAVVSAPSLEDSTTTMSPEYYVDSPPSEHSPQRTVHVSFSLPGGDDVDSPEHPSEPQSSPASELASDDHSIPPHSRRTSVEIIGDLDVVLPRLIIKPSPSASATDLESLSALSTPKVPNGSGSGKSNGNGGQVAVTAVEHPAVSKGWEWLKKSYVYYKGEAVGTVAASDPSVEALNYNQVFVRDFFPSALACLMKTPPDAQIVKNFLLKTLLLQGREKKIDNFTLGEGVMPASFKVRIEKNRETLEADYGGTAIGRVAPIDSGFWWIILLKTYTKATRDYSLQDMPEVQQGIKLILDLCLSGGFDTFPTLLCADACCMIDRRMGIYGYPIEIQSLFFFALRTAEQMLKEGPENKDILDKIAAKIKALSYHIRTYYWLDYKQLNNIYRYHTEEYSHTALNKFNVKPESIPDWLFEFMPLRGGYFIGNVSPARMDFRWFLMGNCIAILCSLATEEQTAAIMDLIEERWDELIGEMPLKIAYPAMDDHEWSIVTGYDSKNSRWSYHNGGSWPVLIWLLTSACIKAGRPLMAKRAITTLEARLSDDGWPEYYDGKTGRYVGKQARKYQTWSIAGYLVAKLMIENPANVALVTLQEDKKSSKPMLTRSASWS